MNCQFVIADDQAKCSKCGLTLRAAPGLSADRYFAWCGEPVKTQAVSIGLGDYTEQVLKGIGITQERYKAAKELFGLAPTCGCDARKEWLNRVSDWWRSLTGRSNIASVVR